MTSCPVIKFKLMKRLLLTAVLFFISVPFGMGQFYNGSQLTFGKNRVQHQNFNWLYYRTNQFDIYFYPTGKELANYVLFKTPQIISEIEKMLNFSSSKKLQFIVYNTQSDFRESNFALENEDFYNQGGVTNIYGTKIYLYFDGNHQSLDKMIRSGVMNIYAHLLVEGQNVGANITSETLMSIPNWFYNGLSSYVGENWNSRIDAYVKNGILTRSYADLDLLSPVDATYAGHSFWKFIVDRFGANSISNILHTTRSSRSYERAFYYVTGVTYEKLLQDWFRYYYVIYKKDTKRNKPEGELLIEKTNKRRDYSNFVWSPDGKNFAFLTNEAGQVKIWLKTPEMSKPKKIVRLYQKTEDNPDLTFPILGWHPNGKILGYTLENRGLCYYTPFNLETMKSDKPLVVDVKKITDWAYSDDGRFMVLSGHRNGQSDIFVYSFQSRSSQQITNDIYDDFQPRFMDNQRKIVFSSNRPNDTLILKTPFYQAKPQSCYDLFLYDYEKKNSQLIRVTNTPYANETDALALSSNEILFLSDENGIRNRYIAHFDSVISTIDTIVHYAYRAHSAPLTDMAFSIFEHNYNPKSGRVADIFLHDGVKKIYAHPLTLTPLKEKNLSAFQEQMERERKKQDSLSRIKSTVSRTARYGFYQLYEKDLLPPPPKDTATERNNIKKTGVQPNALIEGFEFVQPASWNYYVQYSLNRLVTQVDFSFLNTSYQQFANTSSPIYLNTGFNALFMIGVNDLFENHRITGGVRFSFDLQSNEFLVSYENLSKRLDHQISFYRQSINSLAGYDLIRQRSNSIFYTLKYPFTKFSSLRLTVTGRYENYIIAGLDQTSLEIPNQNHVWTGAKLEYVFDSSKELSINLWKGTKLKAFAEYSQQLDNEKRNLFVLGIDARKSVRLFRNATWATRIAASTNFGSGRLIYYMGAIDNWIFAKFNSNISIDKTKNYAYQTLATNMRGFQQNIRNGTSFIVLNTEVRLPFVQLIARKRVGNNFLNSMQFVVFGDIGTAWTGLTPYSEENSLYTRYIESGPISAVVKREVDPFVGGFGIGLRAALLGYFIKLDYAWGVEGGKIVNKSGMFMFSLGLDF